MTGFVQAIGNYQATGATTIQAGAITPNAGDSLLIGVVRNSYQSSVAATISDGGVGNTYNYLGTTWSSPYAFTAAPTNGATSATLAAAWTGTTQAYACAFSDGEVRNITLTNGATTATWSGGLTGSNFQANFTTTNLQIDWYLAVNVAGVSTNVQGNFGYPGLQWIWVGEWSGIKTTFAGAWQGLCQNVNVGVGNAANAQTSNGLVVSVAGVQLIGVMVTTNGAGGLSAGTSPVAYTSRSTGSGVVGGTVEVFLAEDAIESSTGTYPATATSSGGAYGVNSIVFALALGGAALSATGNVTAQGAANLKTQAALAGTGNVAANGAGNLLTQSNGYASVTLAGPLYTGVGGILSGYANWSIQPPVVGSVVWYDPTYMTILSDGEIVGTTNNFTALAQWNTGAGWSDLVVLVTPGLSAVSYGEANGQATITTGIPLNAIGSSVALGVAALSTSAFDQIAAIGSVVANGTAAMTAQISFAAKGSGAANGAALLLVGAGLAAVGNSVATGNAALSVPSQMHAAANVAANGIATLTTGAILAAQGQGGANGAGALNASIQMQAIGQAVANGAASVLTHIMLGARGDADANGVANLAIGASLQAVGSAIANGCASLIIGQLVFATGNVAANGTADFTADGPADPVSIWNQVPGKFNPILGIEQPPFGVFACGIGMEDFYAIDWTIWLAQRWAPGALVPLGYAIQPWPATGFQYVCTQAGASASSVPEWPMQAGAMVIDGSVIWMAEPIDVTSLLTTVVSAQWTSLNGPLVAIGEGYEGQLTPVLIITNGCISGTTYPVECIVSLANETTMTARLLFEVH